MSAIYGLYSDPYVAQQAVDNLRSAGVSDRDITVISSEPFEHFEFGHRDARTAMPLIAAGAGLFGLVATYYLLGLSQTSWPLKTSGMPIVPLWTNLIIIFEMTMLSAIIATVITLLITAGLPSRGGKLLRSRSVGRLHPRRRRKSIGCAATRVGARHRRRSRQKDLNPRITRISRIDAPTNAWSARLRTVVSNPCNP